MEPLWPGYIPGTLSLAERELYSRDPSVRDLLHMIAQNRRIQFENDKWPANEYREPVPFPNNLPEQDLTKKVAACKVCGSNFESSRSTAKFCSTRCRVRFNRR